MLHNMIDQHYNHPSIILWGLGNENDWPGDFPRFDEKGMRAFMIELNGIAHKPDPSRKTVIRRCDFAADIPDVYSPSIWAGWYRGRYTEYKKSEEEAKKVERILHIEWGGDSHARRHSENPDAVLAKIATGRARTSGSGLPVDRRAVARIEGWRLVRDVHLQPVRLAPERAGDDGFPDGRREWIFKDFSTPLRPENPVPRMNQKGVVERDLTPKESYYVFQSYWAEKPMARIYGHTWPIRWGAAGEQKMVKVYSNCADGGAVPQRKNVRREEAQQPGFPVRRIALAGAVPGGRESCARGGAEGRRRRSPTKSRSSIRRRNGKSRRSRAAGDGRKATW